MCFTIYYPKSRDQRGNNRHKTKYVFFLPIGCLASSRRNVQAPPFVVSPTCKIPTSLFSDGCKVSKVHFLPSSLEGICMDDGAIPTFFYAASSCSWKEALSLSLSLSVYPSSGALKTNWSNFYFVLLLPSLRCTIGLKESKVKKKKKKK